MFQASSFVPQSHLVQEQNPLDPHIWWGVEPVWMSSLLWDHWPLRGGGDWCLGHASKPRAIFVTGQLYPKHILCVDLKKKEDQCFRACCVVRRACSQSCYCCQHVSWMQLGMQVECSELRDVSAGHSEGHDFRNSGMSLAFHSLMFGNGSATPAMNMSSSSSICFK